MEEIGKELWTLELGNLPFENKKTILQTSHIEMNRWILQQEKWTGDHIIKRSEMIADKIVNMWKRTF
jgi:hypothetical protein